MAAGSRFTVIVRCADPRIEEFFSAGSTRAAMGLDRQHNPHDLAEAYISNVGGLLSLAGAEVPRLVHDAGLLIRLFGTGDARVVLTAHSTCGGYRDAIEGDEHDVVRVRQEDDLRTTAHRLRVAMPDVSVDCYFLDIDAGVVETVGA